LSGTLRERIRRELASGELGVRDLSQRLAATEREIADAIPHVARSVEASGGRLVVSPAACAACGFRFEGRSRAGKPSRCPECRATRIGAPRFRLEEPG
jgi:predicted Zn-ribbon and HTH transcriptional regulator